MTCASLSIFLLALAIFCLYIFKAHAIIHGEYASPGTYTYHVALNVTTNNICGGVLIDPSFVLTAAHCVYDDWGFRGKPLLIQAGSVSLGVHKSVRLVEKIYVPYLFTTNKDKPDIAVLKLRYPFNLTESNNISLARLPYEISDYTGKTGVVTGFGLEYLKANYLIYGRGNYFLDSHRNGLLKYANVTMFPSDECNELYKKVMIHPWFPRVPGWYVIDDHYLCAKIAVGPEYYYLNRGPCHGDSGGPLVIDDDIVIGLVKDGGYQCDERTRPTLFTRVYHYLDFIGKAMNDSIQDIVRFRCNIEGFQNNEKYEYLEDLF